MCSKLGLFAKNDGDEELISDLLDWMQKTKADYTNTFFALSYHDVPSEILGKDKIFMSWYHRWQNRLQENDTTFAESQLLMRENNPAVIPRNHQVENVLTAANEGDFAQLNNLIIALKTPYIDSKILRPYQQTPEPSQRIYQTYCGT